VGTSPLARDLVGRSSAASPGAAVALLSWFGVQFLFMRWALRQFDDRPTAR